MKQIVQPKAQSRTHGASLIQQKSTAIEGDILQKSKKKEYGSIWIQIWSKKKRVQILKINQK